VNYRQCELRKGTKRMTSWIPERFATQGKYLRLGDDDGWKVIAVHASEPEERVKARERDYKRWAEGRGLRR
jgi:hypothetical protein